MKALELAKLFEMENDAESLYRQAAAELRRLAEVNAELEKALLCMIDWLDDGNRMLSDACAADVKNARSIATKATSQKGTQ